MALTIQITGDASGVDTALARLQGAIDQRMSAIETRLASGEQSTRQFSERSQRHIESLQKSFNGLQATISRITGVLATFGATVSLGALAKGAIETAAGFEQLDTQLKFVVSSMEEFQKARQFILQFTATTPFQLEEVSKAFIDLTRRGFDVQRTLKAVADAAAFQRFPSQALDRIVFALGQIADRGKLAQQELNQLSEAGVPINRVREELARLGVAIADDIGAAGISAKTAIEAIIQVLEKDFRDATLATAGNWQTLTSNLADMWNVFQDTVVRGPLLDFLKGIVSVLMIDMARAIDEDKALFESWGVIAVNAISQVALGLAQLIDLFNLVLSAGSELQGQVAALERAGGEMVGNIGASIKAFLGFSTTAQDIQQDVAQAGQAVADAISSKSPITAAVQQYLDRAKGETARLGAVADKIIADAQARNAQRTRKIADTVGGGAANEGAKAAANAAKAQEQIIEQSLKRQEALIAQSFDERRAQADTFFSEEIRKAPGEAEEIGRARITAMRLIAQEEATMFEAVRLESNDQRLAAMVDQLNKEKAAHVGKVADIAKIEASLQAVYEQHGARQEEIFAKTAAVRQQLSKQATDEEIKDIIRANDIMEKSREQGLEDFAKQTRQIEEEMAREQDRIQTSQLRSYENFVNRVAGMLNDIFTGLLDGTLNAVNFFKRLLIAQLANIGSSILAPFVAGITASVAGALASALPSSIGAVIGQGIFGPAGAPAGGLQGLLGGAGIINTLMGPNSLFGGALSFLTDSLDSVANTIASLFGNTSIFPAGFVGPLPPGASQLNPMASLGGLIAGITGLITALKAKDTAGRVIGGLGGALGIGAMIPGPQQPFLLAASAIVQLLGPMIAKMFSPAGPRFALGGLGGLGIGTGPGGLQVTGEVTSRIGRAERLPSGVDAGAIQSQLAQSVMNMVQGMVKAINTAALKPDELLASTQQALNDALSGALTINSSSAKNFQKDMEEQVKFVGVQVGSFFLKPLNEAFRQLETSTLEEQLTRLPQTTAGMTQIFTAMNDRLDELSKVANTDVLRQLSSVRNRVEDFGNALADTARVVAESIVNRITDRLVAQANVLLDAPLSKQITDFSKVMEDSFRALVALRSTRESLGGVGLETGGVTRQLDVLTTTILQASKTISTQIVTQTLRSLADDMNQLLLQPMRLQAVGVNSLFNTGLTALAALQQQWNQLSALGLDTKSMQEQFSRLLGGLLNSAFTVLNQALTQGSFAEFLSVLVSIPDDLARLNPQLAQLKQLGLVFAQVVGPIDQAIATLEEGLRTTAERITFTETRMSDLRSAIADAGNAVDQALPLYAALSEAIQANAAAQIASVNEVADAQIKASQEAADAQIKASQEAADAQITAIRDAADVYLQAINDAADAQIAAINAGADSARQTVNDAFDAQTRALNDWVTIMTESVNTWADVANTTAGQLRTVNDMILAEKSPAAQNQALLAQEAMLEAVINAGGPGAQAAMTELIRVEQQLLALAKQSNNLRAQQDSLKKLEAIQKYLRDQLVALTGQSDPILAQIVIAEVQKQYLKAIADFNTRYGEYLTNVQAVYLKAIADEQARQVAVVEAARTAQVEAINISRDAQILATGQARDAQIRAIEEARDAQVTSINEARDAQITAIKVDVINQLKALEGALKTLFAGQEVVNGTLHVPVPVRLAQRGGMVGVMLEPGERVFNPPFAGAQEGALVAMNRAFPRFASGGFTVPGSGSGDTVPAMLPRGSFVMNRRAAGALGYQNGGTVSGSMGGQAIVVNVDLRGSTVRNQGDYTRLTTEFREAVREALREIERRSPKRGS